MPFAAFFVAVCLVLCIFDAARKAALCILLGAAVGMASVLHTANRLERIRVQYAGRPLVLTAEVESTADSYDPGIVDAVLHVEKSERQRSILPGGVRVLCRSAKPGKGCREDLYCRPRHPEAGSACMRTASSLLAEMDEDEAGVSNSSGTKAAASAPAPTACSKGSVRRCAAVWTARPAACWLP
ncbi:MAG: hypothetical protein ACLS34_05445 [Faecalibacterium sp.]